MIPNASYFENQIANEEWIELRKKLGLEYCNNVETCDNFFEKYFLEMERLINEIRSNPYESKEDESKLKKDLYELDGMFVLYKYNMRNYFNYINTKFNLIYTEKALKYPNINVKFFHSHNFNKHLSWGYFSPTLFENYYLKQVDAIEEFVQSRGSQVPKYLYGLMEEQDTLVVVKYEYFDWKDIPHERGANLDLPNYHVVSGNNRTLEVFENKYHKYFNEKDFESYFETFKKEKWPIYKWIAENRPEESHGLIKKEDCVYTWEEQTLEER